MSEVAQDAHAAEDTSVAKDTSVVQGTGRLVSNDVVGAYHRLSFEVPRLAEHARPGHFVALAVGGPTSANLLRRCFSIHRADPAADTVDVVISPVGAGTEWLAALRPGDEVDVIGPLGREFPVPEEPVGCVLVGGGYGSAPLAWLARSLRDGGCHVEVVLGAATASRLFGVQEAREVADGVTVTTDDGSEGTRGWVSDVLPEAIRRAGGGGNVYGCGPMGMLRSITDVAAAEGATAHVAVEESMACGVGVCMTCVMPVVGDDGRTRMVRSCVEGPVFRGDRVRWDAFSNGLCRVPDDAVGAPRTGGH